MVFYAILLISRAPLAQYGDVFSFVLAGRKVTVTLGPKGNDFVLGGRTSHVCAEDVYTVRVVYVRCGTVEFHIIYTESHYSGVWKGRRVRLSQLHAYGAEEIHEARIDQ